MRPGLELAEARMLLGDALSLDGEGSPLVVEWNPVSDAGRLCRLAEWCSRFAPIVGLAQPGHAHAVDAIDTAGRSRDDGDLEPPGLLFDLGGCADLLEHRHGGGDPRRNEQRLAMEIEISMDRLGFTAFAAVADTVGVAWGFARHRATVTCSTVGGSGEAMDEPSILDSMACRGLDRVVGPGDERMVLGALPIECLRLDAETLSGLRQLHFERVAELIAIERPELGLRFGAIVPRRLGEALGEIEEMVVPVRPAATLAVHREFATPIQAREGLGLAIGGMLGELCELLRGEERGVERLGIEVERLDRETASLALSLGRANRRVGHLWSLLSPRLEEIDLGLGVERVVLRALRTRTLRHRQRALVGAPCDRDGRDATTSFDDRLDAEARGPIDGAASELADAIVSRFGDEAIRRPGPIEGHLPEACDRMAATGHEAARLESAVRRVPCWPRSLRPTLLRRRPDAIRIERFTRQERFEQGEDDSSGGRDAGGVVAIRWLGRSRIMTEAHGPERIAEPWWRRDGDVPGEKDLPRIREYWRCRLEDGLWVWVFREVSSWDGTNACDADTAMSDVSDVSDRSDVSDVSDVSDASDRSDASDANASPGMRPKCDWPSSPSMAVSTMRSCCWVSTASIRGR